MTWSQFDALRWVLKHPLNRGRQGRALMRWAGTQMRSHIFGHVRAVPFIDDVRLYIGPGLTVPNMQHFAGLGEMDVMGFLMHFLRPDDVFVDVGANVGVISVLGAGIAGARTIAVEPDPQAFKWLRRHAELNGLDGRIATEEAALGEINGTISLSDDRGAANRVALPGDGSSQSVRCLPLDELLADEKPNVIKIDVEGYELPVLRGARNTLRQQELAAVIVELRGHGARYGYDENELETILSTAGFQAFSYDPVDRRLVAVAECPWRVRDAIFLRRPDEAAARLKGAPARKVIWDRMI